VASGGGIDPRVLLDDLNRLPCQVATVHGHHEVAALLQPGAPLAQLLGGGDGGGLYLAGPPALKLLAAAALRAHQEATLAAARAALGLGGAGAKAVRGHGHGDGQRVLTALSCDPSRGHPHHKALLALDGPGDAPRTPLAGGASDAGASDAGCSASSSGWDASPLSRAGGSGAWLAAAAALAESERGSDDGGDSACGDACCGVCLDAAPAVELRPCGHALCTDCCGRLFTMRHADVVACPFCRATVGAFEPVRA
jgi:hypothetical protein